MRVWLMMVLIVLTGCSRPQPTGERSRSSVTHVTLTPAGVSVTMTPVPDDLDSSATLYYRWSPDGRYLVYGRQGDLWLWDSAAGQARNLTATPDRWELMPAWSPDGKQIAFTSRPLEKGEGIRWWTMHGCFCGSPTVVGLDGTGYRVLADASVTQPPSWSPDGAELAYGHQGQIWLFDFRTGAARAVSAGMTQVRFVGAPAFSPVRAEIAFFFSEGDEVPTREQVLNGTAPRARQGYALLDLQTGNVRVLHEYRAPFSPRPPALWSATGRRLALNLKQELYLADPVGLYVVHLTDGKVEMVARRAYQAAWEPNGHRLAFVDDGTVQILTFTVSGWTRQTLRHDLGVWGIAWHPGAGQAIGAD